MPPPIDTDEIASKLEQVLQNQRDADKKLDTLAASWLEMHQRLIVVEQVQTPVRLPLPSLTLEERRDVHEVQTQSLMTLAKSSKFAPYAYAVAIIVATCIPVAVQAYKSPTPLPIQPVIIVDAGVQ